MHPLEDLIYTRRQPSVRARLTWTTFAKSFCNSAFRFARGRLGLHACIPHCTPAVHWGYDAFGFARMHSDVHATQFVSQAGNSVWHGCISSLHACNRFKSWNSRVASPQSVLHTCNSDVHACDSFCKEGNPCGMRMSRLCKPASPLCRRALRCAPLHDGVHACILGMQDFSGLRVPAWIDFKRALVVASLRDVLLGDIRR